MPIEPNDPHYDWGLGSFYLEGYSEVKTEEDGTVIFLIREGDQITLRFQLSQDLNNLNGKSDLKINDDGSGYDAEFNVNGEKFGKGCLIIQKTNDQNQIETKLFSNYLAAVAENIPEAQISGLDEGIYKAALDYELQSGTVLPGYNDYKISFSFIIQRNDDFYATLATTLGIHRSSIKTVIIIASILFLIILFAIVFLVYRRHRNKAKATSEDHYPQDEARQLSVVGQDVIPDNQAAIEKHQSKIPPIINRRILVVILLLFSILCITVIGPWLSKPTTYLGPISYLDEKSTNALLITTGATCVSIIITALPGDTGTPTANELAKLASFLFVVTCVVYAEMYFVTTIGFLSSTIFMPLACLLMVFGILWQNEYRKKLVEWSLRLFAFSLCIVLIIPLGCLVGRMVDSVDADGITRSLRTAKEANNYVSQANLTVDEKNEAKIEFAMSEITKKAGILQWVCDAYEQFEDTAARMLITSIVIPLLMLLLFIFVIKTFLKKDYSEAASIFLNRFTSKYTRHITGIGNIVGKKPAKQADQNPAE